MTDNKITLTKEDIQAIAQELAKQTNNASAQAQKNARGKNPKGQNQQPKNDHSDLSKVKSLGKWVIILIWVIVLVALVIKLTPYL